LRIDPRSAVVHYNLALLLEQTGHVDRAVTHYRRALAIDPRARRARAALVRIREAATDRKGDR
jgi:Tfp pilus assembly protein PilF